MIQDLKVSGSGGTDDETLGFEVASTECSFRALAGLSDDMERCSMSTNQVLVSNVRKSDAEVEKVLADIRDREARNMSTVVTATHMRDMGLDDALLALALKG